MKQRKLWVVSALFYPEETSTGYFLTKIAEGLAGELEVHAICSRPTYSERELEVPWSETHKGVHIHRMRSTRFHKDRLPGRILNAATFSLAATLFCLSKLRRGDQVLVVTNPPTMPPLIGLFAKVKGARRFLLLHDVYPEVLIATGIASETSLSVRLLGLLTAATYRLYDTVIALGRDMAELAVRRVDGRDDRVIIIPNWGDVDEIGPMDPAANPFIQAYNPEKRTLIQFSGNIGRTHDVETVLEAARLLSGRHELQIQFVGGGGKARLVSGRDDPAGTIKYLPRQPRAMLGPMLAAANAVVIPFVDGMLGVSVPSRMYNVMAAATPIIALAHPASELALTVSEEGCGWVLRSGDARGLADLLDYIATPEGRTDALERGRKGRDAATRRFSLPIVLAQFARLLGVADSQPMVSADHSRSERPAERQTAP